MDRTLRGALPKWYSLVLGSAGRANTLHEPRPDPSLSRCPTLFLHLKQPETVSIAAKIFIPKSIIIISTSLSQKIIFILNLDINNHNGQINPIFAIN